MTDFPTPVRPTEDSADFFAAAAEGNLLLRRCSICGAVRGPQVSTCPACHAESHNTIHSESTGTLVSWSVVHRSPLPDVDGPYTVGIVEAREGPWVVLRLLCPVDHHLRAGQAIAYVGRHSGDDGEYILAGSPVEAAHR
ncbi:Zn-ribbon domain-containing OB-fold protein [Rhodococcus tibetensis]|uniref:OB-fold domain-containing protein n=1 Tax=Rhodococcus tibetensis TaxID=2965064 RepID=A0ABT1QIL8_9NOCA|nr:OB-fold domain-containing protein [Rhodococcus sp. FXJ9.536]MCQ4122096.1 OB-fold domain-containing protein [Rhodococcus sp. FXJ9.536]